MTIVERAEVWLKRRQLIQPELDRIDRLFPVPELDDYTPLEPSVDIVKDLLESLKACHDELAWVYRVLQNPMDDYSIYNNQWPISVVRAMMVCHSSKHKSKMLEEMGKIINRYEEQTGLLEQSCPACGCHQYYSKKRGGWYCPECVLEKVTKDAGVMAGAINKIFGLNANGNAGLYGVQEAYDVAGTYADRSGVPLPVARKDQS
jgi:predicted Zn-ribbon and HTH transcriptional regulator